MERYYGGAIRLRNQLFTVTPTNDDIGDPYTFPCTQHSAVKRGIGQIYLDANILKSVSVALDRIHVL